MSIRSAIAKRRLPPHFIAKIQFSDGCWIWTARVDKDGYGLFYIGTRSTGRKPRQAHRIAYEALIGPIPDKMQTHHKCETPACVNPWHLKILTNSAHQKINRNVVKARNPKLAVGSTCVHGHLIENDSMIYTNRQGYTECRKCKYTRHKRWRQRR